MLKVKPFLFILFLTVFAALLSTGCSETGSSSGGGGIYDNSTTPDDEANVTPIDLADNPFSLLGVYDVTLYGIDEEPVNAPASKSELRVGLNLSTAAGGVNAPEVIMSLDFEGKEIVFDKYIIDLSSIESAGGDLNAFIANTFANLGAELIENSEYGLYFTLDPAKNPQYKSILDSSIIQNGQYLKLKLNKIKDLTVDNGLEEKPAGPDAPVIIPVENIVIDTASHSYFRGSNITIEFSLTPSNTTDTEVSWSTNSNGSGIITAVNGKGELILQNVTVDDTVTFTIGDQTETFQIHLTDSIEDISFIKSSYQLIQNETQTITIDNYDIIKNQISNLTYTSNNTSIASVDNNGNVRALKNGIATITATATSNGKSLSASYELDVLGYIDWTDENSLQGTYDIIFFGTNSNGGILTKAVLHNNCEIYMNLWGSTSCKSGGSGDYQIPENDLVGRALIKETNGVLKVHTKVAFKAGGLAATAAPNDQYQYTVYDDATLATWLETNHIGKMPGRNLSELTNPINPKYYFEKDKTFNSKTDMDIIMFSHFESKKVAVGTVNPDTRLILRKISSKVIPMDANSLAEEPFNKINLTLGSVNYTAPSLD